MSEPVTTPARRVSLRAALGLLVVVAIVIAIFVSAGIGALLFLVVLGIGALGGGAPKSDPSKDGSAVRYLYP